MKRPEVSFQISSGVPGNEFLCVSEPVAWFTPISPVGVGRLTQVNQTGSLRMSTFREQICKQGGTRATYILSWQGVARSTHVRQRAKLRVSTFREHILQTVGKDHKRTKRLHSLNELLSRARRASTTAGVESAVCVRTCRNPQNSVSSHKSEATAHLVPWANSVALQTPVSSHESETLDSVSPCSVHKLTRNAPSRSTTAMTRAGAVVTGWGCEKCSMTGAGPASVKCTPWRELVQLSWNWNGVNRGNWWGNSTTGAAYTGTGARNWEPVLLRCTRRQAGAAITGAWPAELTRLARARWTRPLLVLHSWCRREPHKRRWTKMAAYGTELEVHHFAKVTVNVCILHKHRFRWTVKKSKPSN